MGSGGVAPLFLTLALDGVSSQMHASDILPPGKEIPVCIAGGGPRAGLDALEKRNLSCLCRELNPGRPVHSPLLYRLRLSLSS
jgi:hypothetical protein